MHFACPARVDLREKQASPTLALAWIDLADGNLIASKKVAGLMNVSRFEDDLLLTLGQGVIRRGVSPKSRARWTAELRNVTDVPAVDTQGRGVYVATDEGLVCLDADRGAVRWWNHEVEPKRVIAMGERVYVLSTFSQGGRFLAGPMGGRLHVIDARTGQTNHTVEVPPTHATTSMIVGSDGGIWLLDGASYLGDQIESGLVLVDDRHLEGRVESLLGYSLVRAMNGVDVTLTSRDAAWSRGAMTLPEVEGPYGGPPSPWTRVGPATRSGILLRNAAGDWYLAELR